MSDKNAFSKINLQTIDIEKKPDLFEELNLPPEFASFCRKNSDLLKKSALAIVVLVLAWSGFDYYRDNRIEKSAAALSVAMNADTDALRAEQLAKVIDDYAGSDAALWGLLELGHADLKAERYPEAIRKYSQALDDASSDSPLAPLLHLSLAQAQERNKEVAQAITHYQTLAETKGFADLGYMALGRIYEQQGEPEKARDAYEKITNDQSGWAKQRLATLIPPAPQAK